MLYRSVLVTLVLLVGAMSSTFVIADESGSEGVPSPPEDLIIATCEREISLRWNPGSSDDQGIYQYRIYRGSSEENISFYTIVDGTTRVYKDPNGDVDKTFYYYIKAVNEYGESEPSEIVKATPSCGAVIPHPPRNLTYTKNKTSIELEWDEPVSDGGFILAQYRIYRKISDGEFRLIDTVNSRQTNYTDHDVNTELTYRYYVTAMNRVGPSERSEIVTVFEENSKTSQMDLGYVGLIIPMALAIALLIFIVKRKYYH